PAWRRRPRRRGCGSPAAGSASGPCARASGSSASEKPPSGRAISAAEPRRGQAMPQIPDLTDPRYLDGGGWFLYHEKYRRDRFGGSYDAERLAYSRLLRDEVAAALGQPPRWFEDRTVVSIGCGCTGDLAAFPARARVAIDPLLYAYQPLDMLVADEVGGRTLYLSLGAEDLPLLDRFADLLIWPNALAPQPDPPRGPEQ